MGDTKYSSEELEILKETIYHEALGEPTESQIAVAWVILNRIKANRKYWGGGTVKGVCLCPYQFDCWNAGHDRAVHDKAAFESIDDWLPDVLNGKIPDPTHGCLYCHSPTCDDAAWTQKVARVMRIGNRIFL